MKPDWDALGAFYKDAPNVIIGDVDCTSPVGLKVCDRVKVNGYPSIKYWKIGDNRTQEGESYNADRDLKSLKAFVKKSLKGKPLTCDVVTKNGCTDAESKTVDEFRGKSVKELQDALVTIDSKLEEVLKTDVLKAIQVRAGVVKKLIKDQTVDKDAEKKQKEAQQKAKEAEKKEDTIEL